jgi:aminopeptidase N
MALMIAGHAFAGDMWRERTRTYDVLHYALDIAVNPYVHELRGKAAITLVPLKSLNTVQLDAGGMTFASITLRGSASPLVYTQRHDTLLVQLPSEQTSSDTLVLTLDYSCTPDRGFYFVGPDRYYPDTPVQAWSQGEEQDNHWWFPCYDYPNDKATSEMHVTVPDSFTTISNGALLSISHDTTARTSTYFWFSAKPASSYLISLVVGRFARIESRFGSIPVYSYFPPGKEIEAESSFSHTPDMMKLFSDETGFPYPWPKYSQVVIKQFMYGGMENLSAATLTDRTLHDARARLDASSDGLVSHELSHQWFGDLLTCRNWSHAWLNEGFASYFANLYTGHALGGDEFQYAMHRSQLDAMTHDLGPDRRPTVTNDYSEAADLFDSHIYGRGAAILHMLRFLLGDADFWKGIRRYVDEYQYMCVTTDDFEHAMEEASGEDLGWFFTEWVYHAGFPAFEVHSSYDSTARNITLMIEQQQEVDNLTPLYRMPVDVEVTTAKGSSVHRINVEPQREQLVSIPSAEPPTNIVFDKGGWILKSLVQPKSLPELFVQLKTGDEADRERALIELGSQIDSPMVMEEVANILQHDPFWGVRKKAAEVLGWATDPQAGFKSIAPAFRDPKSQVRVAATASLHNFKSLDVLMALGTLVETDSSYEVVAEAFKSLVAIDPANGMRYCMRALSMDSERDIIRAAGAKALGYMKTGEAKKWLRGLTEYGQPEDVRRAAMEALVAQWAPDDDVRALMESLLHDTARVIRRKAAQQLGILGDRRSRGVLASIALHDPDALLREDARRAVRQIDRVNNVGSSQ